MPKLAIKHMVKAGFTWFTLCGTICKANNQPTSDLRQVTCPKCNALAKPINKE